ncbi:MAG TPA: GNAT family N-acetyltransferase [Acidiphilium sp.]|uniref:GNAT family N-acetyltransferase n=1 Tax=unclassified Acidiphilium TaxID=2617493 RepID=UPI000BCABB07|nr:MULTISPECIES: GNAT family N-acetyltransferase [unclassified Acidiphilium]OYV56322.1 MAG: GNAT family N-acetyltransferase [Acidiphilium sp. 20-67-58]OYV87444.1 MAG: GNAT family N-acetyltransferase [Acidiphilium sp. 21-68-69]HQT61051.1 GNAT family N-acetyltransferase [Acidiphilium sp.]HQU11035.1 GNAT family N-acetyltransferase [Acidiphilium sp.]
MFRAWPYLYDGDEAYERDYVATYAASERAAIVIAREGETIIGASTCLPLTDEDEAMQAPFRAFGFDPAAVFYFGESVLLPAYRGRGIGVGFFREREAHARSVSDATYAAFCAVIRDETDQRRPADATTLDAFWRKRGYAPVPDLACRMRWREIGGVGEVENRLQVWMKPLGSA